MWLIINSERPSVETCLQAERAHSMMLYGESPSVDVFGPARKETERAHSLMLYDERPPWTETRKR